MWWNDEIKTAVRRKEASWKGILAASDEETKERCMYVCTERRKIKRCIIQNKKRANEQFWKEDE